MSSSNEKSNISPFLLIIAVITIILLLKYMANLMVFKSLSSSQYKNPNVATTVVEGNIYDANGKKLSMPIPVYNLYFDVSKMSDEQLEKACRITSLNIKDISLKSKTTRLLVREHIDHMSAQELEADIVEHNLSDVVFLQKLTIRTYPFQFHAAQLIKETEKNLYGYISPIPEYNKSTTYGFDIYMTLDMNIQYLLDDAFGEIFEKTQPSYVSGCIVRCSDGAIIAATTYPFFDLNDSSSSIDKEENLALVSEANGLRTYLIDKKTNIADTYGDMDFNYALQDSSYRIIDIPSSTAPQYHLIIHAEKPTNNLNNALDKAVSDIQSGLKAQSKLN